MEDPEKNYKETGFLITPTLLDSHDWLLKAPISWQDTAYQSLLCTLNREFSTNIAVEKGLEFEEEVYKFCNEEPLKGSDLFIQVCEQVKGGLFQQKCKKLIDVDGEPFLLYGKIDVLLNDAIIDIKTTKKFRGKAKYLSNWQHRVYTYCTRVKNFRYVVAEWDEDYETIKKVHNIDFVATDFLEIEEQVKDKIRSFTAFLEMHLDLKEAYYNVYNQYYKGDA